MKSFQRKKIREDKIIVAKEDEGGGAPAAAGGEVVPAPTGDSGQEIVQQPQTPPPTGLTTTDVLGKCDHKKDGIFGPGCFHLPCIWTVPYYRLPKRKKKKYGSVVREDDDQPFSEFKETMRDEIQRQISSANDFLQTVDPSAAAIYDENYVFSDDRSDWVSSVQTDFEDDSAIVKISVNLNLLYDYLEDVGLQND